MKKKTLLLIMYEHTYVNHVYLFFLYKRTGRGRTKPHDLCVSEYESGHRMEFLLFRTYMLILYSISLLLLNR